MNPALIPLVNQRIAKQQYLSNLESWKNFAQRITKNPFVKQYLIERNGSKCKWCQKQLWDNVHIHHISYNGRCTFTATIRIDHPTEKRPTRTRLIPDCERCQKENIEGFSACMRQLSVVHPLCNKEIAFTCDDTI